MFTATSAVGSGVATGPPDVVRAYARSVLRRGSEPMEPLDFEVNWADQPSRHKTYPGSERIPLPGRLAQLATLDAVRAGLAQPPAGVGALERLGLLLRLGYGVLQRRLAVTWNQDVAVRVQYPHATWGRGTASGGGMYPVELYWAAGPSAPVLPGLYHYSTGHHALERLIAGDVSPLVDAATGDGSTDQFLLLSINFWKNAFKYNSFCYHVVTQDLGAVLGTLDMVAPALIGRVRRLLCFDDLALNDLLGLDTERESVFAIVALPGRPRAPAPPAGGPRPQVDRPAFQRSRVVLTFPQVTEVHRAGLDPGWPRRPAAALDAAAVLDVPDPAAAAGSPPAPEVAPPSVALPRPDAGKLARPLIELLAARRSSFGSFRREPPIAPGDLGGVLAGAAAGRRGRADLKHPPRPPELTGLWLFAHRVTGVRTGTYRYVEDAHELRPAGGAVGPDMAGFLQRRYFLTNYSMDQVGAVLAISGRLGAMVDAFGPRGYRMLNAEVGTVAQAGYVAAVAHGLGCGAVLGFDNIAMNDALGLDGEDETTLLFLLLGSQRPVAADLTYRLW